jgi:sulfur relay (sulfurtransferase) DsrC/TusE family protein
MPFMPNANHSLEINANQYNIDEEGFLLDTSDWSREVATGMAARCMDSFL